MLSQKQNWFLGSYLAQELANISKNEQPVITADALESAVLLVFGMLEGETSCDRSTRGKTQREMPHKRSVDCPDAPFLPPAGIVFQSTAYDRTTASQEARVQTLALHEEGFPVSLVPTDSLDESANCLPSRISQELGQLTGRKLDLARSILYYGGEPTEWNLDYYGRCRIGRAVFWTNRIPSPWIEPCNAMDEVWVPSAFHRQAFVASGVMPEKLVVLPSGIDTNLFRPGCSPLPIPELRGFNFLSITDIHDRKGLELLLRAFFQEFQANEDVALILKTPPQKDPRVDLEAELVFFIEKVAGRRLENSPAIFLLEDCLPQSAMPSLYATADALVLPFHGAATGKTLLEALASEVPVIATGWGSVLEFLSDENSYLIESQGLGPVPAGEEFLSGHQWANPSPEHLRQQMRKIYSEPDEARKRAENGRRTAVEQWDWSVVFPFWRQQYQRLIG